MREYFLVQAGLKSDKAGAKANEKERAKPFAQAMDLAEMWFEIQDLLMEEPKEAAHKAAHEAAHEEVMEKLATLEEEIRKRQRFGLETVTQLEKTYDQVTEHDIEHGTSQALLVNLAQELQLQSYLKSLQRDVERIKRNAHSN